MFVVLTADQRRSRRDGDRVPAALAALNRDPAARGGRSFERTAGDEIQGVPGDAHAAIGAVETLLRESVWSVGLGIGSVDRPLPLSTRAGRGPAFVHARRAVEVAKSRPGRVAVLAADARAATSLETVLLLWADLLDRRTRAGWEVADLVEGGLSQTDIARRLGISTSAVSQRAGTAALPVSARARTLAVDLLSEMLAEPTDEDTG